MFQQTPKLLSSKQHYSFELSFNFKQRIEVEFRVITSRSRVAERLRLGCCRSMPGLVVGGLAEYRR